MNNIAIRVEHLSKLYPAVAPRARHLGRAQQRHDTPSTRLRTRLRDALAAVFSRQSPGDRRRETGLADPRPLTPDNSLLWALKDVSFEACPESDRRVQQGEVVGTLAPAVARRASAGVPSTRLRTGIGRNGTGKSTLPSASDRRSALRTWLKKLSRITEPTGGRTG